jgi:hypothetical protein
MPPKTGSKKSAKSEDDTKKKDTAKTTKKGAEENATTVVANTDLSSLANDHSPSSKTAAGNLLRGTSQLGTPSDENTHKEMGISLSELSQHTDGNREGGDGGANVGDNITGAAASDADIKYEEPILPNLIVLRFV